MQRGSKEFYQQVRGVLVSKGTSLNRWSIEQGLSRQWVELCLKGERSGPAAIDIIDRIINKLDLRETL